MFTPTPRIAVPIGAATRKLEPIERVRALGAPVDVISHETLDDVVATSVARRKQLSMLSVNLHWLALMRRDPAVREVAENFDLALVDGTPLRWLVQSVVNQPVDKMAGSDLVPHFCERSSETGWRLFFLGAAPGVAAEAAAEARKRWPGCEIAGVASPAREVVTHRDESRRLCDTINDAATDIVLVAFGMPNQEFWLDRHRDDLEAPVRFGIGASFDFLAGRVQRAPQWVAAAGLEWAWRVGSEPRRLARRYFVDDRSVGLELMRSLARERVTHKARREFSGLAS